MKRFVGIIRVGGQRALAGFGFVPEKMIGVESADEDRAVTAAGSEARIRLMRRFRSRIRAPGRGWPWTGGESRASEIFSLRPSPSGGNGRGRVPCPRLPDTVSIG